MPTRRTLVRGEHEIIVAITDEDKFSVDLMVRNGMSEGQWSIPHNSLEEMELLEHEIMVLTSMAGFALVKTEEFE